MTKRKLVFLAFVFQALVFRCCSWLISRHSFPHESAPGHDIFARSHHSDVVIMVMSARSSFHRRSAARKTWARGHSGVFFIVGNSSCAIPPAHRKTPFSCEVGDSPAPPNVTTLYNKEMDLENKALLAEADEHPDLVLVPMVDTYWTLALKLKLGFSWVADYTSAKWVVKVDDDSMVHVPRLYNLLQNYNSSQMTVMGWIRRGLGVPRAGKNAEPAYPKGRYPPFANGAEGYVVSRGVAESVVKHDGFEYRGEDVSLGIWLDEMNISVSMLNMFPKHFALLKGLPMGTATCNNTEAVLIGHKMSPSDIEECFRMLQSVGNRTLSES